MINVLSNAGEILAPFSDVLNPHLRHFFKIKLFEIFISVGENFWHFVCIVVVVLCVLLLVVLCVLL